MKLTTPLSLSFFLLNATGLAAQFGKANDLYSDKRYAAAIPHFEQALMEKDNLSAKVRLANCYRLTNKLEQAEALYATIVEQPKAKPDAFLHYAEVLMGNGNYDRARFFFEKHFQLEPLDSTGFWMAKNCLLAPGIRPYFERVAIEEAPFNTEADDNSAVFFHGGAVFTSDRPGGPALLKQKAGWTGRDYLKLWWVRCSPGGSFGEPRSFSGRLNVLNKNTANASFTADGREAFFTRNADFTGKDNTLNLQLFSAEKGTGGRWKTGSLLPFCTPEVNYMHPAISPDGSWIVFSSSKKGTLGGFDLWLARRAADGSWSRPENLGPTVNTAQHEGFPFIGHDGRLFFCSKGLPGFGGFDIFTTKKDLATGLWAPPVNLGRPLNGPRDDIGFSLAANDSIGFFTSSRNGDDDDIFLFWLGAEKRLPFEKNDAAGEPESESDEAQTIDNQVVEAMASPKNLDSLTVFIKEKRAAAGQAFLLENIRFDSAAAVPPDSAGMVFELEKLKGLLLENPLLKIEIAAHTEPFQKEKLARKTSEARASFLQKKLVEMGIGPARISSRGLGSKKPLLPCPKRGECPPGALLANRRIEVSILSVD